MSQSEIINKLMKQWQCDVDKYRQELLKYKNELEESTKYKVELEKLKKEIEELKSLQSTIKESNEKQTESYELIPVEKNEVKAEQRSEVFLDYSNLFSEGEAILYVDIHIKNIGSVNMVNPWICLRLEPPGIGKLSGKILPPSAIEAMGVYTLDGQMDGWVFMNKGEEWQKAINRGEYWMQSIQPVVIPPGETETVSGFQITVPKQKGERFVANAFVYFEKNHYESNNKISFQFV